MRYPRSTGKRVLDPDVQRTTCTRYCALSVSEVLSGSVGLGGVSNPGAALKPRARRLGPSGPSSPERDPEQNLGVDH